MRLLRAVLIALVVLALCAGTASAQGRLDRSFGDAGIATMSVPTADHRIDGLATFGGRAYVLDGSLLLAFQTSGEVAYGFGEGGRIKVVPAGSEGEPAGFAVDSAGRLLITGSARPQNQGSYRSYVIRLLPNGSRDIGFGDDGEVTDFGPPTPAASEGLGPVADSIIVDTHDRPVVAGSFGGACGYSEHRGEGPYPFVARLTDSGTVDQTFAGTGYLALEGPGGASYLDPLPAGGSAVFTTPCSIGARVEWQAPFLTRLAESGRADRLVKERPLNFTYIAPAIDPSGRVVELESPPPAAEGTEDALARYLPNGDPDPSFGQEGRVEFRRGYREASAFAVDSRGRPIVAVAARKITLMRFLEDGEVDTGFGSGGRLLAAGATPAAIALDSSGRIYTAGLTRGSSRVKVEVVRFIPGG